MKILVFSDSHGYLNNMFSAIERENPDMVLHLGDTCRDAIDISHVHPEIPLDYVRGNSEPPICRESSKEISLGGLRVFMTHGHLFGVKSSLKGLLSELEAKGCDIGLYGHTHIARIERFGGLTLLNPGSCGYVRRPSYGLIAIENGGAKCGIRRIHRGE